MKAASARLGLAFLISSSLCLAADWPQYLGPGRNAVSTETGLKRAWPANGPEVLWTVPLGEGFGGAAVSQGQVFVLDRAGEKGDVLRALNLKTGREEWNFSYDAPGKLDRGGSRSVPTVDGNFVYICGPFGHFHCLDRLTHKAVWSKNIWTDYSSEGLPRWGIAQNPLIHGELVIVASQTRKKGVVAYDKLTGAERWATPQLPGSPGYVSPRIVSVAGEDQAVMITADGAVVGLDPGTGRQLWSYGGWKCKIPVPNVTEVGDGRIFVTGGYRAG
jgi:outer membrane protein assembly factor BamB